MAITFVAVGAADAGAGDRTATPALPAGVQTGDLLLCYAVVRSAAAEALVATPSGYTLVFESSATGRPTICLYYRIATGSDACSVVFGTGLAAGATDIAQVAAFRGVDTAAPIDVTGAFSDTGVAQDIGPITGITPGVNGAAIVVCGARQDDWTSVATLTGDSLTYNEIGEPSSVSGTDAGLVWDYAIQTTAAAIANKTFTVTGGVATTGTDGRMLSLKPAAAQTKTLTPATTTSVAQPLSFIKPIRKTLTAATTTAVAQALSATKPIRKTLTASAETDAAQPLVFTKPIRKTLSPAAESDIAQALAFVKTIYKTLTPAVETDAAVALSVTLPIFVSLTAAVETDAAQPLSFVKTIRKTLTAALETDAAQVLVVTKTIRKTLIPATGTSVAQVLVVVKPLRKTLTPALEADVARPLTFLKPIRKTLVPATELDVAMDLVSASETIDLLVSGRFRGRRLAVGGSYRY